MEEKFRFSIRLKPEPIACLLIAVEYSDRRGFAAKCRCTGVKKGLFCT